MSNTQKKNVPDLRFPEFEGEWIEKKLGEVAEILDGDRGKNYPKSNEFTNQGHTLFLSASNVTKYGFSKKQSQFISEEKSNSMGNGKLIQHDIVLTSRGSIGNVFQYSDWIVDCFPFVRINSGMLILRTQDILKSNFIVKYLTSSIGKRRIKLISFGSAQPQLTKKDMKDFKIKTPLIREQQKIGDFFSKLDRQIELEEQKLELLQQQKKGYMQKIFSQELRFKDENGEDYPDWKEKKLGDITEQSMYGIGASATRFDSKNIYIRITDIDEKSRKLNYQNLTTPDELNNKYKLKRNDILFARTGASTGKSYIHKEEKDIYNYYFAGFLIKFEIDEQNNPLFIYQFTLTSKFNKWVKVMSVRSGQPGINSEEYAKLPLVLPNKLEQQKIAEFLDRFDQQIELEKQKIEILQQQKKGLLQSMFI